MTQKVGSGHLGVGFRLTRRVKVSLESSFSQFTCFWTWGPVTDVPTHNSRISSRNIPQPGLYMRMPSLFVSAATADSARCQSNSRNKRACQARRRSPETNFWVWICSGRVGSFHVKGWGSKSLVCPSKFGETKLFGVVSRQDCRDIPGVTKKFENKTIVFYF